MVKIAALSSTTMVWWGQRTAAIDSLPRIISDFEGPHILDLVYSPSFVLKQELPRYPPVSALLSSISVLLRICPEKLRSSFTIPGSHFK